MNAMTKPAALLDVDQLVVHFRLPKKGLFGKSAGTVRAVEGVSFALKRGETLAIVGESGCGKTTLGRAVAGLYRPNAGTVRFDGADLTGLSGAETKAMRRRIQMVFQDPFSSLSPRMLVSEILTEPLDIHKIGTRAERLEKAAELIATVGLPIDALNRYPHEFSGGQRQRIAIARALAPTPELIIADEPLSALDVSIQSQVLNLMAELRRDRGLSYLFISHDLAVVDHLSDRVAVMYLGRIVEIGSRDAIFSRPSHPYTQALLDAIPRIGQGKRRRGKLLPGDLPSPLAPPPGCVFHPRCPKAKDICRVQAPLPEPVAAADASSDATPHLAACHFKE